MYYDAVKPVCGHTFCRNCLAPFHDCPVCGADVKGVQPESELQGAALQLYVQMSFEL